jgi:hypothetical protein
MLSGLYDWGREMRLFLFAAAISIFLEANASATAIVDVWTPDEVIVGADAKYLTGPSGAFESICKISIIGDKIEADAGILDIPGIINFDTFIKTELRKSQPVATTVSNVKNAMLNVFKLINDIRMGRIPGSLPPETKPENIGASVFLAYIDNDIVTTDYLRLLAVSSG